MHSVFRVMKSVAIVTALGWIALGPVHGFAQNRFFSGFRGLNLAPIDHAAHAGLFDPARVDVKTTTSFRHSELPRPHFAGALGFRLNEHWRLEGELHHHFQGDGGGMERESRLGLVNLYYDFADEKDTFRPYAGFGAGISDQSFHRGGGHGPALQQDTAVALQAGAGFSLMLNQNLAFSGDYRFLTTQSGTDAGNIQPDDSHALRFGVTYKLPAKRNIDPKFAR